MAHVRAPAGDHRDQAAPADLAGTVIPEGDFVLPADDHRRFAEAVGADAQADPTLIALWVLLSGLRGLPMTLSKVFALAGCDMETDKPMLGGCELEVLRDAVPGRPYRAGGEILGIERKSGARAGTFDLMRVRLTLRDDEGPVGSAVVAYVLPRGRA
jgi:hypothetical protein